MTQMGARSVTSPRHARRKRGGIVVLLYSMPCALDRGRERNLPEPSGRPHETGAARLLRDGVRAIPPGAEPPELPSGKSDGRDSGAWVPAHLDVLLLGVAPAELGRAPSAVLLDVDDDVLD